MIISKEVLEKRMTWKYFFIFSLLGS